MKKETFTKIEKEGFLVRISKYLFSFILVLLIIFAFLIYLFFDKRFNRDAYLYANYSRVNSIDSGQVEQIYVTRGEYVKKGQPLFKQDCTYIENDIAVLVAESEELLVSIANTKKQLTLAKKQEGIKKESVTLQNKIFDRFDILANLGSSSEQESNDKKRQLLKLQSEFVSSQQAKEDLEIKAIDLESAFIINKAKIKKQQYFLGRCTVKAQISGYVSNLILQEGDYVKKGQELFSVVDTSKWYIVSAVKESNLRFLQIGQKVFFTTSATGFKVYEGTVSHMDQGINRPAYDKYSSLYDIKRNLDWIRLDYRFPVIIEVVSEPSPHFKVGVDVHVWS